MPAPEFSDHENSLVSKALGFEDLDKSDHSARDAARQNYDSARSALKQADTAARRGDFAGAKRWSEVAKRLSEAAERLASMPPPERSYEEDEAILIELRDRLARLAEKEGALLRWQMRKEIWDEMVAEAQRTGAPMPSPMPPRPHHWTDDLPEGLRKKLAEQP